MCAQRKPKCLSGGTGRRARLKLVFRKECRFDSGLRYLEGLLKMRRPFLFYVFRIELRFVPAVPIAIGNRDQVRKPHSEKDEVFLFLEKKEMLRAPVRQNVCPVFQIIIGIRYEKPSQTEKAFLFLICFRYYVLNSYFCHIWCYHQIFNAQPILLVTTPTKARAGVNKHLIYCDKKKLLKLKHRSESK